MAPPTDCSSAGLSAWRRRVGTNNTNNFAPTRQLSIGLAERGVDVLWTQHAEGLALGVAHRAPAGAAVENDRERFPQCRCVAYVQAVEFVRVESVRHRGRLDGGGRDCCDGYPFDAAVGANVLG